MDEKYCTKCGITKSLSEFHKNKTKPQGVSSECSKCGRETKKLYRENNKEKRREKDRLYYENNKEKERERHRLYYENNKEKERERDKLYYENNKEKVRERSKLYRENNKEKTLLKHARTRARKKGLPFSITEKDIVIPDVCPVLGIPLFSGEGHMIDNSPNLDRIFPEKGYVPGNVRVISQRANRIKNDATVEEMRAVLRDMQKQVILLESRARNET